MIWKKHPILNYELSDTGEIRNLDKRVLKSHIKDNRYRIIRLRHEGAYVTKYIHRLVLETFVGIQADAVCMHIDNDCTNNNLSNLQWGTQADNLRQAVAEGRHPLITAFSKLTDVQANYIKSSKLTGPILAKIFGVTKATINNIRRGKTTRFRTLASAHT